MSSGAFRALLGLADGDATTALRDLARGEPALSALLAGGGADVAIVGGGDGRPRCEVLRSLADGGMLLQVRAETADAPADELALHGLALLRLAGTLAHEVKNPLNAMALQLALLGDKIGGTEALASACAANLGSLKNQIGRINEVMRRYVDVADPNPAASFDAGALLADAAQLFAHEARRRRLALSCDAAPGVIRAAGDPARAARLLLVLLWEALAGTPEQGRLAAHAAARDGEVELSVEHTAGTPDPAFARARPVVAAAAASMGGRLREAQGEGTIRAALVLPKERPS